MSSAQFRGILTALALILFSHPACHAQPGFSLDWLRGTWKLQARQGTIIEQWEKENDSTFLGRSVFVKTIGDSSVQEILRLVRRGGKWTYISTVQGQNDNQPIEFPLIFGRAFEFIAENPDHDFPQRISYRRIGKMLLASIEGRKGGRFSKQNFDFQCD